MGLETKLIKYYSLSASSLFEAWHEIENCMVILAICGNIKPVKTFDAMMEFKHMTLLC